MNRVELVHIELSDKPGSTFPLCHLYGAKFSKVAHLQVIMPRVQNPCKYIKSNICTSGIVNDYTHLLSQFRHVT